MLRSRYTLAAVMLLALTNTSPRAAPNTYVYSDDFTTDKVLTDCGPGTSFIFRGGFQGFSFLGYLVLRPEPFAEDILVFHGGYMPYSPAVLNYRLPLDGQSATVTAGTLSFDLANQFPDRPGFLQILVECDNGDQENLGTFIRPGTYSVGFAVPDSCSYLELQFLGEERALAEFRLELTLAAIDFLCGDVDLSGVINLYDAIALVGYLFGGGPAPASLLAGDVNCDDMVNSTDVIYLIDFIFANGPIPCDPDDDDVPDC